MLYDTIKIAPKEAIADLRAKEVMKALATSTIVGTTHSNDAWYVDFVGVEYQKDLVTVLARAFTAKGKPIGFGRDGTVEIERFRVFNPPTLVDDPNGNIVQTSTNERTGREEVRILREDPKQALIEVVLDLVRLVGKPGGNIVPSKIGSTVTTIYADASDAMMRQSNASWATCRNATSCTVQSGISTGYMASELESGVYNIYTGFWMFDTSSIPNTDTINSATFSVSLNGDNQTGNSQTLAIGQTTLATWNSPVSGDFDGRGHTGSLGSGNVTHPNGATTGYLDFALNSTGLGWIARSGETIPGSASASGKTQLSLLYSSDTSNSAPTVRCFAQMRMAEQSGTTNDPKLVVDHTAAGGGASVNGLMMMGVGS